MTIPRDLFITAGGTRLCSICKDQGAEGAVSALEKMFSDAAGYEVAFDGYMLTDFASLPKIAEEIGDIEVTLQYDFPEIGKKGDKIAINKDNIEYYFRDRIFTGGSANREARQRNYIHAMLLKLAADSRDAETTDILGAFEYFETDLSAEQLTEILAAFSESKVASSAIETTPGVTDDGCAVLFADDTGLAKYVRSSFSGKSDSQHYTQKIAVKDGKLTLNIDAEVYRPVRESWPVYQTQLHSWSANELRGAMGALFGDAPLKNWEKWASPPLISCL